MSSHFPSTYRSWPTANDGRSPLTHRPSTCACVDPDGLSGLAGGACCAPTTTVHATRTAIPTTVRNIHPPRAALREPLFLLRRGVDQRSRLHAGTVQREDAIEWCEHQRLFRRVPWRGEHLRIFERRLDLERVRV